MVVVGDGVVAVLVVRTRTCYANMITASETIVVMVVDVMTWMLP